MSAFKYEAISGSGKKNKGVIEADSDRQARQQLRDRGLFVLNLETAQENHSLQKKHFFKRNPKVRIQDLAQLTRQLATLLSSGIPLEEAIFVVSEQTEKPHIKSILLAVRGRVLEGHGFAMSLKEFPDVFPPLYCATIAAGEQSGHLDLILNRLATHTEKSHALRQKIKQAATYPAIMMSISMIIVVFLLIYVVPKMIEVFSNTGQTLPTPTLILIKINNLMQSYGIYLLLLILIALAGFMRALKNKNFRISLDHFLLKVPFLARHIKSINTARFCHTLSILITAGTPILDAMNIATRLITNRAIQSALTTAIEQVREGTPIHLALKKTNYFPSISLHLIGSGEASGQLEKMLDHAADNQDKEIEQTINTLMTLFEPMLILFMGLIVLFIVISIMLPIFSMDQLGS